MEYEWLCIAPSWTLWAHHSIYYASHNMLTENFVRAFLWSIASSSKWVRASCCWCDCRTSLIITCFSTALLSQSDWKRNMILSLGEHISLEYLIFHSKHEIQWEKSQGIHQTNLLRCECVFNAHFDGNYLQIIISVHFVLGQKDICSFCIMFFFSFVVANTDTV